MNDVFVSIGELTNQIATGISDWWKQGIIDVGVMITSATNSLTSGSTTISAELTHGGKTLRRYGVRSGQMQ